ncbi:metallophosphoesterase [Aurantibacter sp.]|uniref:metallophosphoesterase n=1 Tax=Aurantibacter sp. TaxID=2807103 RepID=UPI0035C7FB68
MKINSRRRFIKSTILAISSILAIDMFWFERYIIDWNYFDVSKPNTEAKIKVVQLSDLHIQSIKSFHKSIASKINEMKPDLVCFTGDALDDNNNLSVLNLFLELLDPSIKKYAILGNWEYWGNVNISELNKIYKSHNCELLINKTSNFTKNKRTINVIGIDDFVGGKANLQASTSSLNTKNDALILNHCPQYFETIQTKENTLNANLVLSGHTHGGQITFLGIVPFKPQGSGQFLKGLYGDKLKMYVSKGIGTSILPIRFGSRSEVAVFDI